VDCAIFILVGNYNNLGYIVDANQIVADGYPEIILKIVNGKWFKDELTHLTKNGVIFPVEKVPYK
jgi:hypothetical protein